MTAQSAPAPVAAYVPRKAFRDTEAPIIGGVAGGIAQHLALPVLWVRVAFVVAAAFGGLGVGLYAGWWLALPAAPVIEDQAPGIASATRGGRRPGRIRRLGDLGPVIALGALGVGLLLTVQAIFGFGGVMWPLVIGLAGVALLWRQADEAQRERWLDTTAQIGPLRMIVGSGGTSAFVRIGAGLMLVLVALALLALQGGFSAAGQLFPVVVLAMVGIAVVVGPWLYRLATDLSDEREQRVRTQERADVAAHLHDSVLQTLALIQNNAADAAAVARLARSQERDLRAWLYAGERFDDATLASAVRRAAAEVEDTHAISVDVVTVGDLDFSESLHPVVAAMREALTNAAKHAGVDRVDVYVETSPSLVEVFVRDRGVGFDPAGVAEDRLGVRNSIIDRMDRHGGSAEIRSEVGRGTEVRLRLPIVKDTP